MFLLQRLKVVSLAVSLALFACCLQAATEVSSESLAEEYLKKGNKCYIDGDYDQAILDLAQSLTLNPTSQDAVSRLKLVVEQKKVLENSSSFKDFMKRLNETESEKTRKFQERIESTMEILQIENSRKMLELKLESEKIISDAVTRQDAVLTAQNKQVQRMRLVTSLSSLVMVVFIMLNIYLLVYIFRRPAGEKATGGMVDDGRPLKRRE